MSANYRGNSADCHSILELIPDYAFGLTDAAETRLVESNLARCPEAASQLADFQRLQIEMRAAVPQVEPSAALGERLMAAIQSTPAVQPQVRTASQPIPARRWNARVILAAAATLLLIASNVFWIAQAQQSRAQQQQIAAQLSEQEQILALIGSGRAQRVQLNAVSSTNPQAAAPVATLMCDPNGRLALLTVENFPVLPADKVYQLWMRQGGQPMNVGLFRVDESGRTTVVVTAPQAINSFESAGITLEPAGGSPKPTGQPIVRGTLEY